MRGGRVAYCNGNKSGDGEYYRLGYESLPGCSSLFQKDQGLAEILEGDWVVLAGLV